MVLGALGGDLGGILVPRRSKAAKREEVGRSRGPLWGGFLDTVRHRMVSDQFVLSFFCYIIFRFVLLSILGDFSVRNVGLFQAADMPEVW